MHNNTHENKQQEFARYAPGMTSSDVNEVRVALETVRWLRDGGAPRNSRVVTSAIIAMVSSDAGVEPSHHADCDFEFGVEFVSFAAQCFPQHALMDAETLVCRMFVEPFFERDALASLAQLQTNVGFLQCALSGRVPIVLERVIVCCSTKLLCDDASVNVVAAKAIFLCCHRTPLMQLLRQHVDDLQSVPLHALTSAFVRLTNDHPESSWLWSLFYAGQLVHPASMYSSDRDALLEVIKRIEEDVSRRQEAVTLRRSVNVSVMPDVTGAVDDVSIWVRSLRLSKDYSSILTASKVDGEVLRSGLSRGDLMDLGISNPDDVEELFATMHSRGIPVLYVVFAFKAGVLFNGCLELSNCEEDFGFVVLHTQTRSNSRCHERRRRRPFLSLARRREEEKLAARCPFGATE